MDLEMSTETAAKTSITTKRSVFTFLAVVAIIIGAILVMILQLQTPKVVPTTGAAADFSADRAFAHLEKFAVKPHPLGSIEHDRVRDYLIDALEQLGVAPEIQKTTSLFTRSWIGGAQVENIVAKIEGADSTKAVMLVAHYDSVPGSAGVSDDGAGVAAILETVRALKEVPRLRNDVIILISDGEENGLHGAKAFVDEHPWVEEVGLVLNFEARGNEGPVLMFETSDNNGWLIKEFAQAASKPLAHSFVYNIYKLMPNDTDLTVFKDAGLHGLNFAFGQGLDHYHTTSDNLDNLSKGSLQHHGEYMLSLTRHLGNYDFNQIGEGDQLFFNIIGSTMITYSESLVLPIMVFVLILFILTFIHGYRQKQLSILGTLAGFFVMVGALVGAFGIGLGLWMLLTKVFPQQAWLMATNLGFGTTLFISFSILVFSLLAFISRIANKKMKVGSLFMGAMFVWLILVVLTSLVLKAGSYVFVWPLFFALIGANILFRKKEYTWKAHIITTCFAIPAFLILGPAIYMIQMLVGMELGSILMVLVALLGSLLIPVFSTLKIKSNWVIPTSLFALGLLVLVVNSIIVSNAPSAKHPTASDITYFQNADTKESYWIARHALDEYSTNYVNGEVENGNIGAFFPVLNWNANYTKAPVYDLKAPSLTVLSEHTNNGKRTINYLLQTNRQAEEVILQSISPIYVSRLVIDGKEAELLQSTYTEDNGLKISYVVGQAAQVTFTITVDANDTVDWIVADRSYSIPVTIGERTQEYITYGDNTFVMTTIRE